MRESQVDGQRSWFCPPPGRQSLPVGEGVGAIKGGGVWKGAV